ncbi:MAG TPA: hypothetical protein VGR28_09375 [Candidatus Thermoplasmatota archaeon]|nr:hypothetical protein [Candidatus Thermoplasmatota archaeon]
MRLKDLNIWDILAIVYGTVGIVAALGEWVFHWWQGPGDVVAAVGLAMAPVLAAASASRRQASGMLAKQDRMLAMQERMLANQDRMLAMQQKMLAMQEESLAIQRKLLEHAEKQSRLLEEVVASFRRGPEGAGAPLGA